MARLKKTFIGDDGKLDVTAAFNECRDSLDQPVIYEAGEYVVTSTRSDKLKRRENTPAGQRTIERVTVTLEISRVVT